MKKPPQSVIDLARKNLVVDGEGRLFWNCSGHGKRVGMPAGSDHRSGYLWLKLGGKHVMAHHVVWLLIHGEWPDQNIDHIDLDKKNNKPSNLRLCTHQQNMCNKKIRSDSSSGLKGVSFDSKSGKWRPLITAKGKRFSLGRHEDKELAHLIYSEACRKYHGDFANNGGA